MESLWIDDPASLFTKKTWYKFVPTSSMDIPTAMNSIVRFTVYISVILFLARGASAYLLAIPLVLVLTIMAVKLFPNARTLEAFTEKATAIMKEYTYPSGKNPFMNPLLTEILDNPNRAPSAPVTSNKVKRQIEEAFKETSDLYMDTSDKFDLAQSMRTFASIQSGLIPNDQDEFLKFLAKGIDEPDYSSTFLARRAKEKSEGYVDAQGSAAMTGLSNSTDKPTGVTPAGTA
uniref:Minor capsid protein P9 transmembrane helices domain-containing protein n=1 Tax=viral metagenome TaxID=1070528 RepID=A0A6C0JHY0_9ZZZZ